MLMLTGVVVVEPLGGRAASLAYMMKTQRRNQKFISGGGVFSCLFRPFSSFLSPFTFTCSKYKPLTSS